MLNGIGKKERNTESKTRERTRLYFTDVAWVFLIGSVIGFVLEGLWSILLRGGWENHASVVWGPFCIIYGLGGALMYVLSLFIKSKPIVVRFLLFALVGSSLEYAASLFQELVFGSVSWDYAGQLLSIGGRVSLRMTLIWGLLGTLFAVAIFPRLQELLDKTHVRGWQIVCLCLCCAMLVNLIMSAAAVLRWRERYEKCAPSNAFEEYLDDAFDDARMEKTFVNLKFLN